DAGLQCPPCLLVVLQLLMSHLISVLLLSSKSFWQRLAELGEDVRLAQHEQFLVFDGDLGAAVFRAANLVAIPDVEPTAAAVPVDRAVADGDDLALLRLLFGRVGENDPTRGRLLLLDRLDDQPVPEGLQLHPYTSVCAVRSSNWSWHSLDESANRSTEGTIASRSVLSMLRASLAARRIKFRRLLAPRSTAGKQPA